MIKNTLFLICLFLVQTCLAECDRDLLNVASEIFFKNPEHKRIGRQILSGYPKWILEGLEAFD